MSYAKYSFMDFLTNRRIFVSIGASDDFQKNFSKWLKENNLYNGLNHSGEIDKDPFYHLTLWYSKTGQVNPIEIDIPEIEADVENWELLGKNKEHLTMKLKPNQQINDIREEYFKYGLTSDWPSFKPHVTAVYHYGKNKIPNIKPPKTIKFGGLKIVESIDID